MDVLIFGSCVSRDPLGRGDNSAAGVRLSDYYARSSLASLASEPPTISIPLDDISSKFQRRMVERDICKSFFPKAVTSDYDLLLVDFIDDRLRLIELKDGSKVTRSVEFLKSNFDARNHTLRTIQPFSDDFFQETKKGWGNLLDALDRAGKRRRLVVNKVFLSAEDSDGLEFENLEYIESMNKYLSRVYDMAGESIQDAMFMEYNDQELKPDPSHQWGRSPFHYGRKYEESFLQQLFSKRFR